jgi:SAM-dependent methyltransferase
MCQRTFEPYDGVINGLPLELDAIKSHEDRVFADGTRDRERVAQRPWQTFSGRQEVRRFDEELSPLLTQGPWLELGGETCFASAIWKSLHPNEWAVASDVSPNSLRFAAQPLSQWFPHAPDAFIAMDAENIPFADATFGSIFALTMMHHLPHPEQMLTEVHRVLRPGGTFVAVDHCVPRHFRPLFAKIAHERAMQYGIQEALFSYADWKRILIHSPIPLSALQIYTNPRYQSNPYFALLGKVIDALPKMAARLCFPVGALIVYDKPE